MSTLVPTSPSAVHEKIAKGPGVAGTEIFVALLVVGTGMPRRAQPLRAERRTVSVIRSESFAAGREASLCVNCVWGTVRKGYRSSEAKRRLLAVSLSPNGLVPSPVRQCANYRDRRG